ncbi:hypothetical protein H9I49_16190 [Terrabacter sp. MAHUQ-38]|nr:hypothetical protein [Terrabacter sp. MAHUQ-38]
MKALSLERPVFHSEADFQFSFAQAVKALEPDVQCRLERPILNSSTGRTEYLDLLCSGAEGETAIEFKYFTRRWHGVVGNETFQLREHAAIDLLRLHFVHDVARLEGFGFPRSGLAVLLTNEPGLWAQSARNTRDRDFHLYEGRELSGTLLWAEGAYTPNTRELRGAYALKWQDYATLDEQRGGRLRYLALEVLPASSPEPPDRVEPAPGAARQG